MNPLITAGIGGIIETVGKIADDLVTSDQERGELEISAYKAETERLDGQVEINKIEAANNSTWRPFIGKICGWGLAYNFIAQPLMVWCWSALQAAGVISIGLMAPPTLEVDALMVLVTGMLGLGTARTLEKIKGKA